jgi:hypothetical protein
LPESVSHSRSYHAGPRFAPYIEPALGFSVMTDPPGKSSKLYAPLATITLFIGR